MENNKTVTEFKTNDYIVCLEGDFTNNLGEPSILTAKNYIIKQFNNRNCLYAAKDLTNTGPTSNSDFKFNKTGKLKDWRYATTEEITEYNRLGKPYDVTTLNKSTEPQYPTQPTQIGPRFKKDNYYTFNWRHSNNQFIIGICQRDSVPDNMVEVLITSWNRRNSDASYTYYGYDAFQFGDMTNLKEISLDELQQYLPEDHVLKQPVNKYICLAFPSYSYAKARVIKDITQSNAGFKGNLPYIIPAGSITWFKTIKDESDYVDLIKNKEDDYVCPENNRWQANIHSSYFEIIEECNISEPIKYKSIDMIEIQEEAKRRFLIGCKFKCIIGHEYTLKLDTTVYKINGNSIYASDGHGCLYKDGKWAELISSPTEPVIDSWCVEITEENKEVVKAFVKNPTYLFTIGSYYEIQKNGFTDGKTNTIKYSDYFDKLLTTEEFYAKIGHTASNKIYEYKKWHEELETNIKKFPIKSTGFMFINESYESQSVFKFEEVKLYKKSKKGFTTVRAINKLSV